MNRWIAIALGAVFAIWGVASAWKLAASAPGLDFYQFWIGGQEAPHAGDALWSEETRKRLGEESYSRAMITEHSDNMALVAPHRRDLELFSTPFLYTCFGLLPNHYDLSYTIYRIAGLAAAILAIVLIARALRWPEAATLFFIAFICLVFQPLKADLRVGNVNEFQLLTIAAYFAVRRRSALAGGVILGLTIAFKPNVGLALPLVLAYDFGHDRPNILRELGGAAIGGAAAIAVSSAYFRSARAWIRWMQAARSLSESALPVEQGNVSPTLGLGSLTFALTAVITIAAAIALWRSARSTAMLAASVGAAIYVVTAPLVWLHYLLLVVPLGMVLLSSASAVVKSIGGLALTLVAADPWETILGIHTYRGEARLILFGVLALLVATGTLLLRNRARRV